MDSEPLELIRKVWHHSRVNGHVWTPSISNIGHKTDQKFREGAALSARRPELPELRDALDWYWTPAVSASPSRKAGQYPAQRVLWVDCDESFNDELLQSLRPSFVWETSPGHKQALWLMRDTIPATEYHRDGFMGMLTQAIGADPSGVDIGQLLRIPGTWHHKREPYQGRLLRSAGTVHSRGEVLSRVARGLGFSRSLASELGAEDPFGDRSKVIWRFSRNAAELGIPQDLTFKLIKATSWNKWKDEPDLLKEDIAKAYDAQPKVKEKPQATPESEPEQDDEELQPWTMHKSSAFGQVLRTPRKWLVPGIIQEAGCGILVAAPKVGKTRVAMEIALGLATGTDAIGINVRKPVEVGFLSLEDGEYLFAERLSESINKGQGRHKYHWEGHVTRQGKELSWHPPTPMPLMASFDPVNLSQPEQREKLLMTIEEYELKMIIIDTLSMAIGSSNVNDSKDMYSILADLKNLVAKPSGCAIMFIHHTRKRQFEKGESIQERILGSTALHGWSDFILSLAEPEEETPGLLRLAVQTKMGSDQHYVHKNRLKIIQEPDPEE